MKTESISRKEEGVKSTHNNDLDKKECINESEAVFLEIVEYFQTCSTLNGAFIYYGDKRITVYYKDIHIDSIEYHEKEHIIVIQDYKAKKKLVLFLLLPNEKKPHFMNDGNLYQYMYIYDSERAVKFIGSKFHPTKRKLQ